ncbi:MAG TPA: response regulator transcription factor [Chitinophagales bacterium]|nr:response regulator transcription factor [Chitinophagales bacterium]
MEPVKVIIAENHLLLRKGLVALLKDFSELKIVCDVPAGDKLLEAVKGVEAGVLLFDLSLVDNYAVVLETIRKKAPGLKTLVISASDDQDLIGHAIEKGAVGYLPKDSEPAEILFAILTAFKTGYNFNEQVSIIMRNRLVKRRRVTPTVKSATIKFSDKEIRIIQLLSKELSTAEIGKQIYLSHRTVESIRQQMIRKVGARSATGLVLFAAKNGLIEI